MKNNFYLKHQLMARHDSRMELLIDKEGPKGIGVYWIIVEELAMFPDDTTTIKNVYKHLKMYKISKSYITKIIFDYQLFDLFEDDYISPAELNPSRPTELKPTKFREEETTEYVAENPKTKRTEEKKSASKTKNNIVSSTKNNTKQCSVHDENRSKNDEANSFSDAKKHENCKKTLEQSHFPTLALAANSLILNDLRKTNTGIKENIRDIITTTTEKEKEPAAVVDDDAEKFWSNAEKNFVDTEKVFADAKNNLVDAEIFLAEKSADVVCNATAVGVDVNTTNPTCYPAGNGNAIAVDVDISITAAVDAENSYEETRLSQFKQAVCENEFAAFVADKTQNSGNCKHLGLPPPNEVCEAELCNFHSKADCENTIRWAYYVFLPVVAYYKQAIVTFYKPTPQLGKCHPRAKQMPQLSWANATCNAPPSVALQLLSCGNRRIELWG